MKQLSCLIVSLLLLSIFCVGSAQKKNNDWYVENIFIPLSSKIAAMSYYDVSNLLDTLDVEYEGVLGKNDFVKHEIVCSSSSGLTMLYYPLNAACDSKDFGNGNKEMLCSVSFTSGDKQISVSDNTHMGTLKYKSFYKARSKPNKEESSLSALLRFYNKEMGGNVNAGIQTSLKNTDPSTHLTDVAKNRIEAEYASTDFVSLSVYPDLDTSDPSDYSVQVELSYRLKKEKTAKEETEMYAGDMAITLYETAPAITNIIIFWEAPRIKENGVAAKYTYEQRSDDVYLIDTAGYLYR